MRYGLSTSNARDYRDRKTFPAQSTVLDEEAVLERLVPQYALPDVASCHFFSRGDADIYCLQTVGASFYLKIYRPPDSLEKAEAEGVLVNALHAQGASVVPAVARQDGAYATPVSASEGLRVALVFHEAPPNELNTADEETYVRLGEAVARLHTAGDSVGLNHLAGAFDEPLLLPFAERLAYADDFAVLQRLHEQIQMALRAVDTEEDVGWCHRDLALCNIRRNGSGDVVFFDFGNARLTSRSIEMARLRSSLLQHDRSGDFPRQWSRLEQAYAHVRRSPWLDHSEEHWRLLRALLWIQWIGGVMSSCPLRMGSETFNPDWVREQLSRLRELLSASTAL